MQPLEGVKVLELAEYGFVPSAAAVLGDWGAEVIKVEHPRGDPLRHLMAAGLLPDTGDVNAIVEQLNRNKRGLHLDLMVEADREVFDRLVEWADVFITNFLPSARAKLGVRPEDLHAANHRLVYARGSGQGQAGPDADAAGFDSISYWSRGGIGHCLTPAEGPLVMQRAGMGDVTGGAFLAGGVAAGLLARERTGRGCTVDVSLLGTAVWVLAPDLVAASITGRDPAPMSSAAPAHGNALVGSYRTGDGRWLIFNMMDGDRYWAGLCRALGRTDLVDDPRFADREARAAHGGELRGLIGDELAAHPLDRWRPRLDAEGCVWSVLAAPTEVVADRQCLANGYLPAIPGRDVGSLASSPVQFDSEPVRIRRRAPAPDEHGVEIRAELGVRR